MPFALSPRQPWEIMRTSFPTPCGALEIQQGALYPALYRLEYRGLIGSEWVVLVKGPS